MTKQAKPPGTHQFSIDDEQVEILVDALQMRRDYLAAALASLGNDQAAGDIRRNLEATDALIRRLRRLWPSRRSA